MPGSQHFADVGEIELAYHRIRQPAAELNWSQEPLQRYGVIAPDTWQMPFTSPDSTSLKAIYAQGIYLNQQLLDKGLA